MLSLDNLKKLNSECFSFQNYESNWWCVLDMDYIMSFDLIRVNVAMAKYAIGYCEANRLTVRPREDSYAVMFEKEGVSFWFHIAKWEFETTE